MEAMAMVAILQQQAIVSVHGKNKHNTLGVVKLSSILRSEMRKI